ncbi:putative efflux ABC transporter accessory factor PilG [Myxococcus xanthus DK 1622]|uniref:PilG n=3 Tax=Myxococcus TaxID=32 RepID=O30384_MYXXD|nr:PilG [Myxococcus xanthus DK 1622]NOJ56613.1 ABC transporter [Myxococcus xanthus]QVW67265.1 ABC transporter [Myxococcus xanthus DZ2]ABF91768.1 putative efflux ABC transporter accessory factor PilG [Myxococcus xanthus DK 1622]QPM78198.1 ABC transporter [Myxococcus xanthus]
MSSGGSTVLRAALPQEGGLSQFYNPRELMRSVVLCLAVCAIAVMAEKPAKPLRTKDGPILPRREFLEIVGAAQKPLLADFYWLQSIQQVGRANTDTEYRDVFFYADLATDLDPKFRYVYEWGAITTPVNLGRDEWANTDLSSRLLSKGLVEFPDDRRFLFQLAYNKMTYDRDYKTAADQLMKLSKYPETPPYLLQLATRLYAQAGSIDMGLQLAQMLRDGAEDDESRAFYEHRIKELLRERLLTQIDEAVAAYQRDRGERPKAVPVLVRAGYLRAMPIDPLEGQFFIDRQGRARSTSGIYRLEMFDQKKKDELREDIAAGGIQFDLPEEMP